MKVISLAYLFINQLVRMCVCVNRRLFHVAVRLLLLWTLSQATFWAALLPTRWSAKRLLAAHWLGQVSHSVRLYPMYIYIYMYIFIHHEW